MKENSHTINGEIKNKTIKLINEDKVFIGDVSLQTALNEAKEKQLDLVEMSEKDGVSTCRLMDYKKFLYEQKKHKKETKSKVKVTKEIKFRPVIEKADLQTKIKQIKEFLTHGHPVKIFVEFKNSEIKNMKNMGYDILTQVKEESTAISAIKQDSHEMGKSLLLMLDPIKV